MKMRDRDEAHAPLRRWFRILCTALCALLQLPVAAQESASKHPAFNLDAIAAELNRINSTDSAKAYGIFKWITSRIDYDVSTYFGLLDSYKGLQNGLPDTKREFDSVYNRRVAEMVLRRGEAICDGYARLYLELAQMVGLKAVIINGYGGFDLSEKPAESNHSWNAVRVNGKWMLLDACWGAGYLLGKKYSRYVDRYYFNTPPEHFILNHYPESPAWTLINKPPSLADFFSWPKIFPGFIVAGGKSWFPREGHLRLKRDSVVIFRLIAADTPIVPDIGYRDRRDEYVPVFKVPRSEVVIREGRPTRHAAPKVPATGARSKVTRAERKATDAIMSYVDSMSPEPPDVSLPEPHEIGAPDKPVQSKPAVSDFRTYRNVFEYRFRVPADISYLEFYHRDKCIIQYAVEVIP